MRKEGPTVVNDAVRSSVSETEEEPVPSPVAMERLEENVDLVIADHATVVATLERRARHEAERAGFTTPLPRHEVPRVPRRAWDPAEVHLDESVLAARQERQRLLRELKPGVVRPVLDPPLVTRAGVFYVPPEFFQARGIDRRMDAALLRGGIRSFASFLGASDRIIADLTGLSLADVSRAKDDLDLSRVLGVDGPTAELLRLAGIHSVSALAAAEPAVVQADVARLWTRHRFHSIPARLSTPEGVAALVEDAQGRA